MRERATSTRRTALTAIALATALTVPTITNGAQRTVLGEYFNALW